MEEGRRLYGGYPCVEEFIVLPNTGCAFTGSGGGRAAAESCFRFVEFSRWLVRACGRHICPVVDLICFAFPLGPRGLLRTFFLCRHCPMDENPDLVNPILIDYVRRHSAAA